MIFNYKCPLQKKERKQFNGKLSIESAAPVLAKQHFLVVDQTVVGLRHSLPGCADSIHIITTTSPKRSDELRELGVTSGRLAYHP